MVIIMMRRRSWRRRRKMVKFDTSQVFLQWAKLRAKHYTGSIAFNPHNFRKYEVGTILITISQMEKLRQSEVQKLAWKSHSKEVTESLDSILSGSGACARNHWDILPFQGIRLEILMYILKLVPKILTPYSSPSNNKECPFPHTFINPELVLALPSWHVKNSHVKYCVGL